jgi:hypothetical protein
MILEQRTTSDTLQMVLSIFCALCLRERFRTSKLKNKYALGIVLVNHYAIANSGCNVDSKREKQSKAIFFPFDYETKRETDISKATLQERVSKSYSK